MTKRVIITGANSRYFGNLTNLLGSVFAHYPKVDQVYVYDLGLSALERRILKAVQKVDLRSVPPFCPHYLEIESFAWKTAAMCEALDFGGAVLWLDAGIELQASLEDLFATIEKDGYLFNVTPLDQPNCKIGNLSHARSLELLDANEEETRDALMVNAGVMGYLSGHAACALAYQARDYARNAEIIVGPRYTHRHDQTIYSVLRVKNRLPAQYHMFLLPNINVRHRILIRATQQGTFPEKVVSSWKREDLHIYLLVTRTERAYALANHLRFKCFPVIAWLMLLIRIIIGRPMVFIKKRIGKFRNKPIRTSIANRTQ